jgi:PAS domain S-box-containing protein
VSEPSPPESPPPSRATVLVASSDSATRDLLRRILNVPAVDLVDAADGVEALALAAASTWTSWSRRVPRRHGRRHGLQPHPCAHRRRPAAHPGFGLSSERAIEVALTSGADETLAKPLNPALLRYRTRVLLVRHQEERRLRLVQRAVEAAPAGVAVLDARSSEYEVAFANPSFLRQTGYPAAEILGHNLRLLAGPATDVAALTELRQAMADGRPTRVLLRSYRKDGRTYWNDLAAAPVVDASGRLTHYVNVQSDVTSLLEAPEHEAARGVEEAVGARTRELEATLARIEERRRFTETILNAIVSAILATDAQGKVMFANLAALRTLGTSLHDCVGRSVVELFGHHEGVAEVIAGSVPAHPEHRLDFPMISPGGTRFYVGMSISPAPPALRDEVAFIFLFRDLAETIDIQTDPKLMQLAAAHTRNATCPLPGRTRPRTP